MIEKSLGTAAIEYKCIRPILILLGIFPSMRRYFLL
jgi:hypothetical protein